MQTPRFSVLTIVKNRKATIQRCIESILAQDYPDVELVVQDGASTDGTLEILRSYNGRLALQSEPDKGATPAFFKALERCTGTLWCVCMSDEALPPGTLNWAAARLRENPKLGVVYGDAEIIDFEGKVLSTYRPAPALNFEKYLIGQVRPIFSASFWRLEAIRSSGLTEFDGAGEVEQWLRVAAHYPIRYFPRVVSRYGYAEETLSNTDIHHPDADEEPHETVINQVLKDTDKGRECAHLRERAHSGVHLWHAVCLLCNDRPQEALPVLAKGLLKSPSRERLLDVWDKAELLQNAVRRHNRDKSEQRASPVRFAYDRIATQIEDGEIEQAKSAILFLQDELHQAPLPAPIIPADLVLSRQTPGADPTHPTDPIALNLLSEWLHALLTGTSSLTEGLKYYTARPLFIYGGGNLGGIVYQDCLRNGIDVSGIIDQRGDSIRSQWNGTSVYTPRQVSSALTGSAMILLALYRNEQEQEAERLLRQLVPASCPILSWKLLSLISLAKID